MSTSLVPNLVVGFNPNPFPVYGQFARPETPESVVFDSLGDAYISLGQAGTVCKVEDVANINSNIDDPSCAWKAQIPIFADTFASCNLPKGFTGNPLPIVLGVAIDEDNERIYASAIACHENDHRVWSIDMVTGDIVGGFESYNQTQIFNGLVVNDGYIYAADYGTGKIWRAEIDGDNVPSFEIWAEDEELLINRNPPFWGSANGLEFWNGDLYVANSSFGTIVKIEINRGTGKPLKITKYFQFPDNECCSGVKTECTDPDSGVVELRCAIPSAEKACLPPVSLDFTKSCSYTEACDEFTLDSNGDIYCATGPYNRLLFLDVDNGSVHELLRQNNSAPFTIDVPTSAKFLPDDGEQTICVTSAAFRFNPPYLPSIQAKPTLSCYDLDDLDYRQ